MVPATRPVITNVIPVGIITLICGTSDACTKTAIGVRTMSSSDIKPNKAQYGSGKHESLSLLCTHFVPSLSQWWYASVG